MLLCEAFWNLTPSFWLSSFLTPQLYRFARLFAAEAKIMTILFVKTSQVVHFSSELSSELHTRRRENLKSHSSPWWWRKYVPLKRRPTIILHGSTSQKTILNYILAAVRTWNLTHRPDDGGSTYLWNVGRQLFYTAVYPRRQFWTTYSPPWELEISLIALMVEAVRTSETSADNYFTRQYIPEDNSELHTRRRENLKSHMVLFSLRFNSELKLLTILITWCWT
jgi:hypothetical protein